MNESRIQQILSYEKKALEIHEAAVKEADQIPLQAQQEVQALIAKGKHQAEEEAQALLEQSQTDEECARILDDLAEKLKRTDQLAKMHQDRAVDYVLARLIGMEQN